MATCLDLARDRFRLLTLGNGYRSRPHSRSLYAPKQWTQASTSIKITLLGNGYKPRPPLGGKLAGPGWCAGEVCATLIPVGLAALWPT